MSAENKNQERRPVSLKVLGGATEAAPAPVQAPWRSLEEKANAGDPAWEESTRPEFADGAEVLDPVSRRGFVQLLGTSLALSGAGVACHRPRQKIIPYINRPPEVVPGNPLHFPTALTHEGYGFGVLVESHEGRPTKLEGNPEHPDARGAATVTDQAYVSSLYDDDRAKHIRYKGGPATWKKILSVLGEKTAAMASDGGARLRFLVEPTTSPLLADLRAQILKKLPNAKFVSYASGARDNAVEGARLAFGRPLEPRHLLRDARVIVALDADPLDAGPESVILSRQFADRREPGADMNRLYVVEPTLTVTGMSADHRLRVKGSDVVAVVQALVSKLSALLGRDVLGPFAELPMVEPSAALDARKNDGGNDGKAGGADRFITAMANDLVRNRGTSALIAGPRQPAFVHALVAAMNEALGNVGSTVNFVEPLTADAQSGPAGLRALADEMNAGKVDTLVITAWNPVYAAPGDIDLAAALAKVPTTIYWTLHVDETADVVAAVLPAAHGLESWGDVRGLDGTVSIVQPLIDPLWTPITAADVLSIFLGQGDVGTYALLQAFWRRKAAADGLVDAMGFEAHWEHWLATGIVPKTAAAPVAKPALDAGAAAALRAAAPAAGQGTEVALVFDAKMGDGRHANSAWLQELPHPVTKMTWDNAITLSTSTAGELGLKKGDIATLSTADGRSVTGPVFVQPGQADDSITVALGYGRRRGGKVAVGVGFDAAALRTTTSPWFVRGVRLEKARGKHLFGITQDHGRMEGRDLALATTLAEVSQADSAFFKKVNNLRGPLPQIIEPVDYSQEAYKWGMSIDLSRCTGCGACAAACQSENNIAVVGRDNVRKGREMNWIRVDRYYEGSEADPTVVVQPIPCQHCETAPCEYVCPVNATVHSDEGLNEMVYNRCIGTRYCSNNCPYKVRRFNFLDFHGDVSPVRKMVHNPDVTVRSRGVMEKCTYCVQRIERVRIDARVEGRGIADGEVVTACQQTCPAGAISFGSLNDPGSKVSQKHADPRRYDLLHEINTRPRTVYLARVRNPNPELV